MAMEEKQTPEQREALEQQYMRAAIVAGADFETKDGVTRATVTRSPSGHTCVGDILKLAGFVREGEIWTKGTTAAAATSPTDMLVADPLPDPQTPPRGARKSKP